MNPYTATTAARGLGKRLSYPQRVLAEPGRQTLLVILWSEIEVWEAFKLSQQSGRSPAAKHAFWLEDDIFAMTDLEDLEVTILIHLYSSTYFRPLPRRKVPLTAARE